MLVLGTRHDIYGMHDVHYANQRDAAFLSAYSFGTRNGSQTTSENTLTKAGVGYRPQKSTADRSKILNAGTNKRKSVSPYGHRCQVCTETMCISVLIAHTPTHSPAETSPLMLLSKQFMLFTGISLTKTISLFSPIDCPCVCPCHHWGVFVQRLLPPSTIHIEARYLFSHPVFILSYGCMMNLQVGVVGSKVLSDYLM